MGTYSSQTSLSRPTVLVVDDEKNLADLYADWLAGDYAVEVAYSGIDALKVIDDEIDVIHLDRRMPGLSGDQVLERIREQGFDIRIAIVSAVDPDFDIIGMGFDEYLTKPVERAELVDATERLVNRTRYTRLTNELAQVVAARNALEEIKTASELRDSDEYIALDDRIQQIEADIESLQQAANESVDSFDADDYMAIFRDL